MGQVAQPRVQRQPPQAHALILFLAPGLLGFYLLIAVLFVWSLLRRIPMWLLALAALACVVELATTAPGLVENLFGDRDFTMMQERMSAEDPRVELTREFGGAAIALAGVLLLWRRERRRPA